MITAAQYQKREKEVEEVKDIEEDEPRIVEVMDQGELPILYWLFGVACPLQAGLKAFLSM